MTNLTFLNLANLKIIDAVDKERDIKEIVEAAKGYYASAGIHTRLQTHIDGICYLQERTCKNILLVASNDSCNKKDLEYLIQENKRLPYYAVARGFKPGIYRTWEQCKLSVDGYNTHKYKKFNSLEAAIQFMKENGAPLVCYDYLM